MATAENVTPVESSPRRISLEEYEAMIRDGSLGPDDKLELLDGLLVKKMTKGVRHITINHRIYNALLRGLPPGWNIRMEAPISLPGGPRENAPSMPEPDVTVLRGPEGTFDRSRPLPTDIIVAIEVASDGRRLAEDRQGLARYAWNNVQCVWIVNLAANTIEVYTRPTGPCEGPLYEETDVKRPGQTITVPLGGENDVVLDVGELLA